MSAPRQYPGVMVSSTFADLREHRVALMNAIEGQQLHPVAMESDSARLVTVVESSLQKVRDAAAYIAIIGRRYGSVPSCPENPDGLSLTHLEFREAVRLGRPILVFVMGSGHLLTEDGFEFDAGKRAKLEAFREEAKFAGGEVHRVYAEFNDLGSFTTAAIQSVAELRRVLDVPVPSPPVGREDHVPAAPALYAKPRYLGSHDFVGREAQLTTLNDWAHPDGQHSVLLFEAIGGSGKSILTWEWTKRHALGVRGDWAGRFWYSFYEAGAIMSDFCRHALAYMTGDPLQTFAGKQQPELTELVVRELESRPWLLVLDGLERVLVAYHRLDAAQVLDEDAGGSDEIAHRDPTTAIRPEDDDLLRRLAGVGSSRVLITSRLVPRQLLNQSSQPIPGVLHHRLPGLRPSDAEALLRNCQVTGDSEAMRSFLQRHCDCHPLVTGIVAGLVNEYLPARGDFDRWAGDPQGGGSLDVGRLDLVQKRNHILREAIRALATPSAQLLSTMALLSDAVDYETLKALSLRQDGVTSAVPDLERRGLLQYDRQAKRYDLHPVVRAVVADELTARDREMLGGRVVDHFSARRTTRYDAVSSMDELRDDLTVVGTLLRIGRLPEAADIYVGGLNSVLRYRFEAFPEMLSLIQPFFGAGWSSPPAGLPDRAAATLANSAAGVLRRLGDVDQALALYEMALRLAIRAGYLTGAVVFLSNVARVFRQLNLIAASERATWMTIELADRIGSRQHIYRARRRAFVWLVVVGRIDEAEEMWESLAVGRTGRGVARLWTETMLDHAWFRYQQGDLTADVLAEVEAGAHRHRIRYVTRGVHRLRGTWLARRGDWERSAAELSTAVSMARQIGMHDGMAEARLALANLHLGRLTEPVQAANELAAARTTHDQALAELWLAIGDVEQAEKHALAAYRWAWADGEPYVRRFDLDQARRLLEALGAEIPVLPPYDPANDPELPWEANVRAYMESLRRENGGSATRSG